MDEKKPLVSVLMTVYNREKYIAEAIKSVLASSYTHFELIIVDDCSTDKSVEIAKTYETRDKRIKVYVNKENLGDYPNRNKAASYAKGKYIKYLDSDDIIYPHGLEVMVNAMEEFPEAAYGLSFNSYMGKRKFPIKLSSVDSILYHFTFKGLLYIGPSGAIYKKEFFDSMGKFNPDFKVAADYEFNLRAANNSCIVLFQRDLIWWRQHDGQEIINSDQNDDYIKLNYQINEQQLTKSPLTPIQKKRLLVNNKILMGRRLSKMIFKFNFLRVIKIIQVTQFPMYYFIRCIFPTTKVNYKKFSL